MKPNNGMQVTALHASTADAGSNVPKWLPTSWKSSHSVCLADTCKLKGRRASRGLPIGGGQLHSSMVAGGVGEGIAICSRVPSSAWSSSEGTDDTQLRIHAEPLRPPVVDLAPDPSPSGEEAHPVVSVT